MIRVVELAKKSRPYTEKQVYIALACNIFANETLNAQRLI
ncbi:hypothetical protein HMPREF9296_0172 [Prevotella disiens FB035-09AN]|uniref:Uncharacterized protein n=1 Tax=Prevotella disiens FB035-09AN TaxID=866771 RepID=E1KUC4_9BACT|nr:hypothetical protein HMPREF9296_0172 [Prevotella disiens FB035-09AN]